MSLRFAILGLLTADELSGYEITQRFASSVGYFWHARSQQIYPELSRLEEAGLVAGRQVEQKGRPDKRVYAITEAGLNSLREWAVMPSPPTLVKDEFLVKVWCYGKLEPAAALSALREQRAQHEERLSAFEEIRRSFPQEAPAEIPDDLLGAYLTLECGIAMQEAFAGWFAHAEALLKRRAGGRG
jgi:DNA-binding PadR family transcriptional regulator